MNRWNLLALIFLALSFALYTGCNGEEGDDDDETTGEETTEEEYINATGTITAPPCTGEEPSPLMVGLLQIRLGDFEEIDYGNELLNETVEIDYDGETSFVLELPALPPEEDFYIPDPDEAPELEAALYIPIVYDDIDSSGGISDDDPLYGSGKLEFIGYARGTIPEDYEELEGLTLGWQKLSFQFSFGEEEPVIVAEPIDTPLYISLSGLEVSDMVLNGLVLNSTGGDLNPRSKIFFAQPPQQYILAYGELESVSGEEIPFSSVIDPEEEIPDELFDESMSQIIWGSSIAWFFGMLFVDTNEDGTYFPNEPITGMSYNELESKSFLLSFIKMEQIQPVLISSLSFWNASLGWNLLFFTLDEYNEPETLEFMDCEEIFEIYAQGLEG